MGRLSTFAFGFLLGGVAVYSALHFHVVRAEAGMHVIPKLQSTFAETYVDIRGFGVEEWNKHRMLAGSITRAGKTELFRGAAVQPIHDAVHDVLNVVNGQR